MPCLVDKMRVARDRVNFATDFLELAVFVGEFLKLRRANERKIGRIKEKDVPFAENVRFADSVVVRIFVKE